MSKDAFERTLAMSNRTQLAQIAYMAETRDKWGYNLSHLYGVGDLLSADSINPIVFLGDSITEGQVSTEPFRTNGFAGRLENILKTLYGNGGNGIIPFWRYKNSTTSEIAISGGNSLGEYYKLLNAAVTYSMLDDGTSNAADLYYEKYNGGGKIQFGKGSTYVSVQTENATDLISVLSLTGLTPSVGNITGWTENFPCRLIGILPKLTTITKGVICHNLGYTTKTGATWLDPAVNGAKVETIAANLSPKLEIIAFGANDYNLQTVVATYKSSVKDAVNKALARNSKVILVNTGLWNYEIPTDPKTIKHTTYENALYEIADECDVALCDVNAKWRSTGLNKFLHYLQDGTVHPNDSGHTDIANTIAACMYNR